MSRTMLTDEKFSTGLVHLAGSRKRTVNRVLVLREMWEGLLKGRESDRDGWHLLKVPATSRLTALFSFIYVSISGQNPVNALTGAGQS